VTYALKRLELTGHLIDCRVPSPLFSGNGYALANRAALNDSGGFSDATTFTE
jgi:hypothetical protein